jgi:hypothetical protein
LSLWRKKTPSLLFMLREEEFSFIAINIRSVLKNIQASWRYFPKLHFRRSIVYLLVTYAKRVFTFRWFSPFSKHSSEDRYCVPFLCHMQHDVWCLCHAKWCDDVMLCEMVFISKIHAHPCNKTHNLFISALTFRCKPPLGAEREMCPWAISKYFGDWVSTQGLKCESMPMDEHSANLQQRYVSKS